MKYTLFFVFVSEVLLLAGCVSHPEIYAPPVQRKPAEIQTRTLRVPLFEMNDPSVDRHIVKDIARGEQSAAWRWTNQRPTIAFDLITVNDLRYRMDFAITDVTFKQTGPIAISYFVNDQLLETVRYPKAGEQSYRKAIPPAMLRAMTENTIAAEIDKPYIAEADGAKLGVVLVRMGLER